MAEENETFFSRLRKLCRDVDQNIRPLKEDLYLPPRGAPHLYDRGLNQLKKKVQELKDMNEEARKVQWSVHNFSNWLHSMQEFVDKQGDDISKIEKHLVKFGYVPMEKPVKEVLSPAVLKQEKALEESSKNIQPGAVKMDGKSQQAGTAIKVHLPSEKENEASCDVASKKGKSKPNIMEYHKTPVSSKAKPSLFMKTTTAGDPYESHSLAAELGLREVDSYSLDLTPDVVQIKKLPMKEKKVLGQTNHGVDNIPKCEVSEKISGESEVTSNASKDTQTPLKNNVPNENPYISNLCGTPVEPELSEYTTQFLMSLASARENRAVSRGKDLHSSNIPNSTCSVQEQVNYTERPSTLSNTHTSTQSLVTNVICTPEEPVLSYQNAESTLDRRVTHTPEEPILSCQSSIYGTKTKVECKTPEEPVLSHISESTLLKSESNRTPEEPVLSFKIPSRTQSVEADLPTPEEPLLSYQFYESESVSSVSDRTPEEPVLSGYASAMSNSSSSQNNLCSQDIPASPELSDITMSFLALQNKKSTDSKDYSMQYSYDSRKYQFSRNGQSISEDGHGKRNNAIGNTENVPDMESKEKARPFLAIREEKFRMDALPPSPQLSETTMRFLSRKY